VDFEMKLPLSIRAPGQARRELETTYADTMERPLLDDVKLMASELVTNAVQHSRCPEGDPLSLRASVVDGVLRVALGDNGSTADRVEPRSAHPPSGLGVVRLLSDRWSSDRDGLFTVWFEIDVTPRTTLSRANAVNLTG
jgi:anti-sigma regulatory factor (Ser/Thr protein kinase)